MLRSPLPEVYHIRALIGGAAQGLEERAKIGTLFVEVWEGSEHAALAKALQARLKQVPPQATSAILSLDIKRPHLSA